MTTLENLFAEPFDAFLQEHDPSIALSVEQIRLVREYVKLVVKHTTT